MASSPRMTSPSRTHGPPGHLGRPSTGEGQLYERSGTLPPSVYDSGMNFTLTPVSEEGNEMMRTRVFATLGAAGVMCASFAGVAAVSQAAPASSDKVTICHRTGSATNPYVAITVSKAGAAAHLKNHDGTLNWSAAPYKAKVLTVGGDFVASPVTGSWSRPSRPTRAPSSRASSVSE